MRQFPCAVERDLARYEAEINDDDRRRMAVESWKAHFLSEMRQPLDEGCGDFFSELITDAAENGCTHLRALLGALGRGENDRVITELKSCVAAAIERIAQREAEMTVAHQGTGT